MAKTRTRTVVRYAPRRRGNHHSKKSITIPIAALAGFFPLISNIYSVSGGGLQRMMWMAVQALTGYDTDSGKWWAPNLNKGAVPILLGFLVHWLIGQQLGLNKALRGVPFIRI